MLKVKPKVAPEHDEQCALVHWSYLAQKTRPELWMLFAVPNGGHRSKAAAGKIKAEGAKSGVPDLCLPVARAGHHGLFIEMKRTSGSTTSAEQREWIQRLTGEGYKAVVCKGWESARKTIEWYLDGEKDD